ncbi:MAG: MBL fold metallo-hydrolase [Caulobacteraceae bacterium]
MRAKLEVTILGCGSSGGVPRADGDWGACDPADPRNRRSRCSLMVRRPSDGPPETWTTLIVDASPEFRLQAAEAGARRLDGLLLTHDHADQSHGLDDIRAFAIRQRAKIPVWMDEATARSLRSRFSYIFEGQGLYPAIAEERPVPLASQAWRVEGPSGPIEASCFWQDHGVSKSLGYRFGEIAYSSDVVDLGEEVLESLGDLTVWIVDALRYAPHPTHAHVEKTLAWIERVKPQRAILTNLHIDLDFSELAARLPSGVEPAFDQLRFEMETDLPTPR